MAATSNVPVEIGRANEYDIKVTWKDAAETIFPARFLRLACPCAGCIEEMTGKKILNESTVPQDVHPLAISPVGRYAIQIQWSDGHNTGLYTWERLSDLAKLVK